MFFVSPGVVMIVPWRRRRFLFADFLVRIWLLNALMRFTFPEPVILKRFLAPLCDFIFGIEIPFYVYPAFCNARVITSLPLPSSRFPLPALFGRQDHGHELPFELRIGFDLRHIGELRGDPIYHLTSELRVCDLSAPEHQRHLYLVSVLQELPRVTGLRHEVVLFDSRPVLHFLQVNDVLLLFGLARHLRLLELEFPVVHDAGHGWPRHWCNFHEIQSLLDRGG